VCVCAVIRDANYLQRVREKTSGLMDVGQKRAKYMLIPMSKMDLVQKTCGGKFLLSRMYDFLIVGRFGSVKLSLATLNF